MPSIHKYEERHTTQVGEPKKMNTHLGCFESFSERDGQLGVSGWLLWPDGPADTIAFRKENVGHLIAEKVERPDLNRALPHIPDAEEGGFSIVLPLSYMREGPIYECDVIGYRGETPLGGMRLRYHTPDRDMPLPPHELMERIALSSSEAYFMATGLQSTNDLLAYAEPHIPLEKVRRFLDWGCGCGRFTRHVMERLPHTAIFGVDIDEECIRWMRTNHPGHRFILCDPENPDGFKEGAFDLIFATSMFTQITKAQQDLWLPALARMLAAGGLLLATTHGPQAARLFNQPVILEETLRDGFFDGVAQEFQAENDPNQYFRAAFQTEAFTREAWSSWLEVLDHHPCGLHCFQDLWVMRRRD